MRLPVNHALPLALIAALIGAGAYAGAYADEGKQSAQKVTGPAADYPVVVGPPFQIGGTTYTPDDTMNYDAVGQAVIGSDGGAKITAAHKTLPLPSYAEVTSLTSGKTILLRVERRGPMVNDTLIELSPGAAAQLGLTGEAPAPVRVRRVNPPEQERAMLRAGGRAPERMETPKGLLDALNRKLAATQPAPPPQTAARPIPAPTPAAAPKPATAPLPQPKPTPTPAATPTPQASSKPAQSGRPTPQVSPKPSQPAADNALIVQVAAFSTKARADGVVAKLGGHVSPAGRFWRVWFGPFTARADAEAALAKAKAAGYSDARIQRAD